MVLVFDISRWGRFQDIDESAYYEFHCRKNHVRVEYCAETFANDGSPLTAILKNIKRAMAAEYSRLLSVRTSAAMRRMTEVGHFHGGAPSYGLRRMMVASDGRRLGILEAGVQKGLRTARTILIPGPKHEVDTVREIFRLFVEEQKGTTAIARVLNAGGSEFRDGCPWKAHHVWRILRSERYIGRIVFYRTRSLLGTKNRIGVEKTDPTLWVRSPKCFDPLVSTQTFASANAFRNMRGIRYRDDKALLVPLRRLLQKHGYLSDKLIKAAADGPCPTTYRRRFGGLRAAYAKMGYVQGKDYQMLPVNIRLREASARVLEQIQANLTTRRISGIWQSRTHTMLVNDQLRLGFAVARYSPTRYFRHSRWVVRTNYRDPGEAVIVVRMDQKNETILDYFLIPRCVWPKYMFRIYPTLKEWTTCRYAEIEPLIDAVVSDWQLQAKSDAAVDQIEDADDLVTVVGSTAREKAVGKRAARANALPLKFVRSLSDGTHPVRVWRQHRKLTIRGLSTQSGISSSYLSKIERREKPGSRAVLIKLARKLRVPFDDLSAWL
jgi:DNA invertase Pin-like site-specific DNA recombinase